MKGRKPCVHCGGPKGPGKARRYCDACREVVRPHGSPRVCTLCGGPKEPGRGRKLCAECLALHAWRKKHRLAARWRMQRLPCRACGRTKESGRYMYCNACLEARKYVPCRQCGKPKPRGTGHMICDDCTPVRQRKPCVNCGGPKGPGRGQRYCPRCKADEDQRRVRTAQSQRIYYHLAAERNGRTVAYHHRGAHGAHRVRGSSMDVEPFVAWLNAVVDVGLGELSLGDAVGASDRYVLALRSRAYPRVGLEMADRALQHLDQPIRIDGTRLYERLVAEAEALPGNGWRLLRYLDRAETVAHLEDEVVERLEQLWPELAR